MEGTRNRDGTVRMRLFDRDPRPENALMLMQKAVQGVSTRRVRKAPRGPQASVDP